MSMAARMRLALSHAAPSLAAMMGRSETLKPGLRPNAAAEVAHLFGPPQLGVAKAHIKVEAIEHRLLLVGAHALRLLRDVQLARDRPDVRREQWANVVADWELPARVGVRLSLPVHEPERHPVALR